MRITTTKCDQCGAVKGDTNKWFVVLAGPGTIQIVAGDTTIEHSGRFDLCGEKCVGEKVSGLLPGLH